MSSAPGAASQQTGRFVTGSTMRHVVVLTATTSLGVVTIFVVDLANLFYISLLGDPRLTAAVGYGATLLFFHFSVCIGLMIASTALVARALGAQDRTKARRYSASGGVIMFVGTGLVSLITLPLVDTLLGVLGATGETKMQAAMFVYISLPSMPLLGLGMGFAGLLRAVGDAKRAMYATLILGGAAAALDPVFILVFGWGVPGAAIVGVIARIAMAAYSWRVLTVRHNLVGRVSVRCTVEDLGPLMRIAVPAVLTNIATPVGNGYITAAIAVYGDHAVAGWTIISRLSFVAFGPLWALSGAIGPVVGQNFGARIFERVRRTLTDSLILSTAYVFGVSLVLYLARNEIAQLFGASGEDAVLVVFFCAWLGVSYVFLAALFVANAAFNNLGYPTLATALNWGRATIGTIPFVWLGSRWGGAEGALTGYYVGGIPFGIVAIWLCYRLIARLGEEPTLRRPFWQAARALVLRSPAGRP